MAQHDYDIANQSGANFRADLNNALDAIVSNNSGSSEPSTTFAYEWWIDTTNNVLKLRNSANNAWISLPLSITADNSTPAGLTVNGNLATTGTVDVNGQEIILDADADTSMTADTDDQIDFRVGGVDVVTLTNSNLVLKGTTPTITLGDGGEEDVKIIFDGNATDFYIGLRDNGDKFVMGTGQTLGTNQQFEISSGDVGIGVGGTNPMSLSYTGTTLALNEASGTASFQIDGGNAARIDLGMTNTRHFALFSDASNFTEFKRTTNHPILFGTNNTERMRILGGGNVGIGNTSPSVALGVTGAIIASDNITAYGTPSDIRLKENIVVIDNALDKVKQLKGITYDLKSDGNRLTGLIAQDLEKVLPEAVYETSAVDNANDKHLAIRYGNTVGLLVEAIKELEAKVQILENK